MAINPKEGRKTLLSNAFVYLVLGLLLSPAVAGVLHLDIKKHADLIEILTQVAVTMSLFIDGLKMNTPLSWSRWKAPILLGGPVMLLTIIFLTLSGYYLLGLPLGFAILLGAILSPTDPVLASAVSIEDAKDQDESRFTLSGEAGFNDGTAFPFVILGLSFISNENVSEWIGSWLIHRILWAVPVGLLLGYYLSLNLSRFGLKIRRGHKHQSAPNDFLAIAIIALSYSLAEFVGSWGFLAAYASGLGMREAANQLQHFESEAEEVVPEDLPNSLDPRDHAHHPKVAAGVVISDIFKFGGTAERLLELALVSLIGVALGTSWTTEAIPVALLLFCLARPVAVWLCLSPTSMSAQNKNLISWFGLRGIGSLYYLCYALNHLQLSNSGRLVDIVVSVVALSVIAHTLSVNPILRRVKSEQ